MFRRERLTVPALILVVCCFCDVSLAQRRTAKSKDPSPPTQLSQLRDEYVKATKDYKASLEKLLSIYEENVKKAEERLTTARKLYDEGLIAKAQVEENERAVGAEQDKVAETRRQMANADSQIADVLVEAEADAQLAKNLRLAKNKLVRTTSFTRYTGTAGWGLGEAWKVQRFFSETFHKPLPVAVFGQGAIHEYVEVGVSGHFGAPEAHLHLAGADRFDAELAIVAGNSIDPHISAMERWGRDPSCVGNHRASI